MDVLYNNKKLVGILNIVNLTFWMYIIGLNCWNLIHINEFTNQWKHCNLEQIIADAFEFTLYERQDIKITIYTNVVDLFIAVNSLFTFEMKCSNVRLEFLALPGNYLFYLWPHQLAFHKCRWISFLNKQHKLSQVEKLLNKLLELN